MERLTKKLLFAGSLSLSGLLCGCGVLEGTSSKTSSPKSTPTPITYSFDNFVSLGYPYNVTHISITQIGFEDLDNDGDKDIIVGSESGEVIIYENKISQKKPYQAENSGQ